MDKCTQCDNEGMFVNNDGKKYPCNYCLTGRLQAEISKYKAGNVPVSQIISDNETMAIEIDNLQERIDKLVEAGSDLAFRIENPKFADWCGKGTKEEIFKDAMDVLIAEQARKEINNCEQRR